MKRNVIICIVMCMIMMLNVMPGLAQYSEVSDVEEMSMSTLSVSSNVFTVDNEGKLWGWGQNWKNVFRTEGTESLYPTVVFDAIKTVSTGGLFVLAVRQDDTLWGWGNNRYGQMGQNSDTENESAPIKIMDDVASVAAGGGASYVIKKDGSLWTAGYNFYGNLGIGTSVYSPVAQYEWETEISVDSNVFIKIMENVRYVHAGLHNAVAVDDDNNLWVWGRNRVSEDEFAVSSEVWGLIIDNTSQYTVDTPYMLMEGVRSACVTEDMLYILTLDGKLIEWESPTSQKLLLHNVKYVNAGSYCTVAAITFDDRLVCWGIPFTGIGDEGHAQIAEDVAYAAVGSQFISYIDKQNRLFCAGLNVDGLAGNGEMPERGVPTPDLGWIYNETHYVYPPVHVLSNVAYPEIPAIFPVSGMSAWAADEVSSLNERGVIPGALRSRFQSQIRRDEFTALMVNVYESVKGPVEQYNSPFTDIEGSAYKTAIEKAKTIGLIDGVAPTRFSPGGLLTREQAAKILCDVVYRIEGIEPKPGGLPDYTDSASISGWATMYVAHAQENGIMLGASGRFNPKGNLTREEAMLTAERLFVRYGWGSVA